MGREITDTTSNQNMSYTVEQLVAVNPYNPDILPDLENYVNEQVSSETYSLKANLCLLRLYQFEPERTSTTIVARVLIKALMAMPAPDFSLCLFLIPERVQMEEQFKTLIVLSHYLETVRFRQFWDEAAKNHHILDVIPELAMFFQHMYACMKERKQLRIIEESFEQAIQACAIHIISLTYQKVPRSVLAEAINIEGSSLDKFIEHHVANSGWAVEKNENKSQFILLPRSEFNYPELKKNSADGIRLEQITRILPILG